MTSELSRQAQWVHRRDVETLTDLARGHGLPVRIAYDDRRREFVVSWDAPASTTFGAPYLSPVSFGGRFQVVHAFLYGWCVGRHHA